MEQKNTQYEDLMIRVFDGYATEEEHKALDNWLLENTAHQQQFAAFKKIWKASPDANLLNQLNIEGDLAAVKAKATLPNKEAVTRVIAFPIWRKIAAVLLPLAVIATALFLFFNQKDSKSPILLADGTKVWLYKNAIFDYPEEFSTATRLVKLTGEAYFEVAENPNKPFIIETGEATIRVLGTSFNVQGSAKETNVIVNAGKVQLAAKNNAEKMVELTKGEKGIYRNETITESINIDKNYRAWQTGIFEFNGTISIADAMQQLSKYYGKLDLDISANQACLLEATFDKEDRQTVVEVIRNSCGL